MAVLSSTVSTEEPQVDGRFWTLERHELSSGETREFYYLADAGADVEQIMRDRATALGAE